MGRLLGEIGTIEWCRRTNGVLDAAERRRYMVAVLLETARFMPRLLLYRAGLVGAGADPSLLEPPDTALTRRVLEACAVLDPMLIQHSIRSYLFARALGLRDGIACDDEALFVATMLHDYAFPTTDTVDDACFTLTGAEVAAELLREAALSPGLIHDILDGITLHLNPRVGRDQGGLQHLLHAGVLLDAVGARAWELDPRGLLAVQDRHPRHGFSQRAAPGLRAHATRVQHSRAHLAFRCGFDAALLISPWPAHERRTLLLAGGRRTETQPANAHSTLPRCSDEPPAAAAQPCPSSGKPAQGP